jgi:lipopolysaccharide transport system ATP-binding protein
MPVKRYSSGMYVRLAFSVAAHLDPDVLIVDEVLAVGDAQFQRKCLGRMEAAGQEGRTVIFVSHNLSIVENLCPRALLIDRGRLAASGSSTEVIARYLDQLTAAFATPLDERTDRSGKGTIRLLNAQFIGSKGVGQYAIGDDISIQFDLRSDYPVEMACRLSVGIYGAQDNALISCDSALTGQTCRIAPNRVTRVTCRIVAPPLNLGEYHVAFAVFNRNDEPEDWISSLTKFSIASGVFESRSTSNRFPVLARFEWLTNDEG